MGDAPAAASSGSKRLYVQVLVAIALGVLLGLWENWAQVPQAERWSTAMKPLSDGFVKLVKMIITPIIFTTVVVGIASMRDVKRLGRVGWKALLYFEVVTTVALLIGLAVVHLVQPGAGMRRDPSTLDASAIEGYRAAAKEGAAHGHGAARFLLDVIPDSVVGAFAKGEILPVLFFAVLFGCALTSRGEAGRPIVRGLEDLGKALFAVVALIMRFAPLGAFGAMAYTVGRYGPEALGNLALLMGAFYATAALFVFVVLGAIARRAGVSILRFLRYIGDEIMIVLGTSSSESALPPLMEKLERMGCSRSIVGLVVPTGYSFNLDGTSIYLTMAAVFVAQATDTPLTWGDELSILAVLLLTSKGAAAVTGGGFITLAGTLESSQKIPVAGLSLLVGIDRFMSEARAIVNLIGNGVATIFVSWWEGELDLVKAERALYPERAAAAPTSEGAASAAEPAGSAPDLEDGATRAGERHAS